MAKSSSSGDADTFAIVALILLVLFGMVSGGLPEGLGGGAAKATGTGDLLDGADMSPEVAKEGIDTLFVAAPGAMAGYTRDEFPHWRKALSNGWSGVADSCDVREATLLRDGKGVEVDKECRATEGTWTDPYTGRTLTEASQLQIDHMVPLAEAWRTGASKWSKEQRQAFANDPQVVLAVESAANASKGDRPPTLWTPSAPGADCGYAVRWIEVKVNYVLSVTEAEKAKLSQMLATCPAK